MYLKFLDIMSSIVSDLPVGYERLGMIASYGGSYFDTGIIFDKNMQIEANVIAINQGMWGAGQSGVVAATLSHSGQGVYIASVSSLSIHQGEWHEYVANDESGQLIVDGVVKGTFSNIQNFVPSLTCAVFAVHQGGYIIPGTGMMKYFRIRKHSGELLCNYVPCRRYSDGAIGMIDLVTHTFKTSLTQTPFYAYNQV